jgi:hypothetical protein
MEATMTAPDQQNAQQNVQQDGEQGAQQGNPGNEQRSENLLPAEGPDDGQFNVAEEVNLDQQGDMARRVGQAPKGIAADALADSLKDDKPDA